MKKVNLLLKLISYSALTSSFLLISQYGFAQVKISSNPTPIGTNTNLEVESTNGTKVIIDKTTGQLGVGITNPTHSIDVSGTARLRSIPTNTVNNQILTVDSDGVIAKQNAQEAQLPVVIGALGNGIDIPSNTTADFLNTGTTITLSPQSRYLINVIMLATLGPNGVLPSGNSVWLRSSFFNSATDTSPSSNIVSSRLVSGILDERSV